MTPTYLYISIIALGTGLVFFGFSWNKKRKISKLLDNIAEKNGPVVRPAAKKALTQTQIYKQNLNEKAASFNRGGLDPDAAAPIEYLVKYFRLVNDLIAQKDVNKLKKVVSSVVFEKYLKIINAAAFSPNQYSDVAAIVKHSQDNKMTVVFKGKGFNKKEGSFKFEKTWHIQKSATGLILMQD